MTHVDRYITTQPITFPVNQTIVSHFPVPKFIIENALIVNKGKQHYWKAYTESGKVILIPIIIEEK